MVMVMVAVVVSMVASRSIGRHDQLPRSGSILISSHGVASRTPGGGGGSLVYNSVFKMSCHNQMHIELLYLAFLGMHTWPSNPTSLQHKINNVLTLRHIYLEY